VLALNHATNLKVKRRSVALMAGEEGDGSR